MQTQQFAFGPRNYRIMWVGLAVLAAGFVTMMMGDKANYGEDFLGITLGPLLLVAGFVIEFFAIMLRDRAAPLSGGDPAAPAAPGTAATTVIGEVAMPYERKPATAPPAAPSYKRS